MAAAELFSEIDRIVSAKFEDDEFNGVVLVADSNEVVYQKAFGIAKPNGDELTTDTMFNLASVSKPMIAYGVLILASQGKFNLEDNVKDYLDIPYEGIQIRHLLNHTAGLPDHLDLMDDDFDYERVAVNADVITALNEKRPPIEFKPGRMFEYSNCAYALLGCLIEAVSKQDVDVWLQESLFKPLAMTSSIAFNLAKEPVLQNRAYGIDFDDGEPVLDDLTPLDGIIGDGQIYATAADVRKFALAASEGKLIKERYLAELFRPGQLNNEDEIEYSLGWFVDDYEEYGVIYHSGSWVGFQTMLYHCPEAQSTIVILDNMANDPEPLADALFEFISDDTEA